MRAIATLGLFIIVLSLSYHSYGQIPSVRELFPSPEAISKQICKQRRDEFALVLAIRELVTNGKIACTRYRCSLRDPEFILELKGAKDIFETDRLNSFKRLLKSAGVFKCFRNMCSLTDQGIIEKVINPLENNYDYFCGGPVLNEGSYGGGR